MQQRLAALESMAQKEGLLPSGDSSSKPVTALSDITISGFATASYFHDSSEPKGGISPGYLWNRQNDNFTLNKVKLTLASAPVERSGENFSAGFRASLIYGQDAPIVNSGSKITGFGDVREGYVEMNIPVGTGLNVKAGELISLLNYESGDGGAANNNFSQGFQWFYTGNGPSAGVQLGYNLTDKVDVKLRVDNGIYAGPVDSNTSKNVMGAIGVKPTDKIWLSFIGFGGRESAGLTLWGASMLGGWQATEALNFGTELDYFNFHYESSGHAPVYSMGLWTAYDFTKQVGLALRAEFLSDSHGVDFVKGDPLGFQNTGGQDLSSLALTLNYKPLPNLKIQPEVRYDHTSNATGFSNGKENRIIFGAGATYLF